MFLSQFKQHQNIMKEMTEFKPAVSDGSITNTDPIQILFRIASEEASFLMELLSV
jgi:hypothetical protein